MALGWGCHISPFLESPRPVPEGGTALCVPGGADPCQGWALWNPGLSPTCPCQDLRHQRIAKSEVVGIPHWIAGSPGPLRGLRKGHHPLLIHLQYEEVLGTLSGEGAQAWRRSPSLGPPQTFHLLGHSLRPGIQKSNSPADWSDSLCSPWGAHTRWELGVRPARVASGSSAAACPGYC